MNRLYRNLWVQIAIILVVITSVGVLALGMLLIDNSQRAVRNSVLNSHKEIVARAAAEIGLFFQRSRDILNSTAVMLGTIYGDPWRQETVLVELVLNQPIFLNVSSLDASGGIIATSDLGNPRQAHYPADALQKALEGRTSISAIKYQDNNHSPYLTMTVPVRIKGKVSGALVADVNLRGLWDIVDKIRLDSTGRAFLVAGDGMLLAHQDKKQVLKNENLKSQKDVSAVLSGRNEAIELRDAAGKEWVSSYAPIAGTGWGIVLRQEQEEAYLFSRIMKVQAWIIIILSEIIAAIIAVFIARFFVKPIKSLLERVRNASSENMDAKISIMRHDEIGELIKVFNSLTDRLHKAKESEKFSTVAEAAGWVAHELKNSLAPIKSFVQLLPEKHRDGKFIDKFSDIVPEEIGRCERMLKDLSDFSFYSELKMDRVNIQGILESVLKMSEEALAKQGIKTRFLAQDPGLYIQADPERIKQLFINLVLNAIHAMPEGGTLSVLTGLIQDEGPESLSYVEVRVSDTGVGIPPERLKNIFEPPGASRKSGFGLGLAISQKIVERHHGQIRVESQADKGTIFTVRFLSEGLPAQEGLRPEVETG